MINNIFVDFNCDEPSPLPEGICEECCGYGWTLREFCTSRNIEFDGEMFDDWVDCLECNGEGEKIK